MRIATNKVKDLISFYYTELNSLYSQEEIGEIVFRIFEHFLQFTREDLVKRGEENVNQSELILIYDGAKYMAKGKPLQYVLKEAWFYEFPFYVNSHVLIPRPETEELVDIIIKDSKNTHQSILDIGTGSGCIAITLAKKINGANVEAIDISEEALKVAEKNARTLNAVVDLKKVDVLNNSDALGKYSIIVSNPPYIKRSEEHTIHSNVKDHEPHTALFVEDTDAIVFYKRIIDLCKEHLMPDGKLYFELNPLTANDVLSYARNSHIFKEMELVKDMSGNTRFFKASRV